MRPGRHVLLDLTGAGHADGPSPDVVVHEGPLAEVHPDWVGVGSALIRPDGHVARVREAAC
ncbi:hypothetical protein [Streptomyces flavofungini]|uniref:hypothetical protein n=1 Tax=Streptomyces flavofungini TaxID=68200 RepID=UPI0035712D83